MNPESTLIGHAIKLALELLNERADRTCPSCKTDGALVFSAFGRMNYGRQFVICAASCECGWKFETVGVIDMLILLGGKIRQTELREHSEKWPWREVQSEPQEDEPLLDDLLDTDREDPGPNEE